MELNCSPQLPNKNISFQEKLQNKDIQRSRNLNYQRKYAATGAGTKIFSPSSYEGGESRIFPRYQSQTRITSAEISRAPVTFFAARFGRHRQRGFHERHSGITRLDARSRAIVLWGLLMSFVERIPPVVSPCHAIKRLNRAAWERSICVRHLSGRGLIDRARNHACYRSRGHSTDNELARQGKEAHRVLTSFFIASRIKLFSSSRHWFIRARLRFSMIGLLLCNYEVVVITGKAWCRDRYGVWFQLQSDTSVV